MADVKNQTPMLDPIAYRPEYQADLGWAVLQNADMNLNQYGDDSSAANYNDPAKWGWANQKYTGETTKNSQIAYDPNMTIDKLDPNYKYGWAAQLANSKEANYIASRNDNIASALYNAWTTSRDDVEAFLNTQSGFFDSNFNERQNTINSIYKRLWDYKAELNKETPEQEKEKKDVAQEMEKDFAQEQAKLYWKVTADGWNPINGIEPLTEWYAINQQILQSRINKVQALQNMNVNDLANIVYSWTTPYGETAMRDWKKYDPEWYAEYERTLKSLYAQDRVDVISHGAAPEEEAKSFTDSVDKNIENDIKNFEKDNTTKEEHSASYILNMKLESDEAAQTAKQEMLNIKQDVADIEAQIEDLPRLAREKFKGDTPDYLVQAFISNNQQRLQRELSKLESRYNAAAEIYKTEVAEKQREAEFELKQAEYNRALTNDEFDRTYKNMKLMQDSITVVDGKFYMTNPATWEYIEMDDVTAYNTYQAKIQEVWNWLNGLIGTNCWMECEGLTDKIAKNTAWVEMEWSSDPRWTTRQEKVAYATWWGFVWYYDENWNPVWDSKWEIYYGDDEVYDIIPQVWDIAVLINNGNNKVNADWWHTAYVDKVWTDENGKIVFHYIQSNEFGDKVVTEGTRTLDNFKASGWVWFRNPFKQAQRDWSSSIDSIYLNPMEPIVDKMLSDTSVTESQRKTLSRFRTSYQKLYKAKEKWYIDALLNQWVIWSFIRWFDLDTREIERQQKNFGEDFLTALMQQLTSAAAKELDWDAYMAFIDILWIIETKLREESWARINANERKMDFMEYLPEASDSQDMKQHKLENLEEYLRGYAKQWWITAEQYVPIFTNWRRQYD